MFLFVCLLFVCLSLCLFLDQRTPFACLSAYPDQAGAWSRLPDVEFEVDYEEAPIPPAEPGLSSPDLCITADDEIDSMIVS